ncbi:MAG: hypothetical protein ACK53A_13245 [Gemmatimonadota bacterium]|jgi:hypothetical protein|nr:hypothetical protein [Gemmatimonadota bacterium]
MPDRATLLEWTPFRAAPGVSDTHLLAAADRLTREFLAPLPGYVRRFLLRQDDGSYVDCIAWRSAKDHAVAMETAMTHPAAQDFFACLEDPEAAGAAMRHFTIAADWT